MPITSTMENGVSYNTNSELQRGAAKSALSTLLDIGLNARRNSSSSNSDSVCIADYGCSGGQNSIIAIDTIIQKIINKSNSNSNGEGKSSSSEQLKSITVLYNDQPTNDWTVAIDTIINSKDSYLHRKHSDVQYHTLLAPVSFYEQICADNSVDIGYSNMACHWLSRLPCHIPDRIFTFDSTFSGAADIYECQKQAEEDWVTILSNRYHELKHDGVVLLNYLGLQGM